MLKSYVLEHRRRLVIAVLAALYLKYLLIPTGVVFYELYHLTKVDAVYWGYTLFKGAGYYFGIWPYQTAVCVLVAMMIAIPWRAGFAYLTGRHVKGGEK